MSTTAVGNKIMRTCNWQKAMEKGQNKAEVITQPEIKHRLFNCRDYGEKGTDTFQV